RAHPRQFLRLHPRRRPRAHPRRFLRLRQCPQQHQIQRRRQLPHPHVRQRQFRHLHPRQFRRLHRRRHQRPRPFPRRQFPSTQLLPHIRPHLSTTTITRPTPQPIDLQPPGHRKILSSTIGWGWISQLR